VITVFIDYSIFLFERTYGPLSAGEILLSETQRQLGPAASSKVACLHYPNKKAHKTNLWFCFSKRPQQSWVVLIKSCAFYEENFWDSFAVP
jgi:hypothetical protein